jgi:hypothetical protein
MTSTSRWACSCNWDWNWSWDWRDGAPTSSPKTPAGPDSTAAPAPTETYDTGPVTQQNTTDASAEAVTDASVSQTADQSPGADGADSVEAVSSAQTSEAGASAGAVDQENLAFDWGVATGPLDQANELAADATAVDVLDVAQVAIQRQSGGQGMSQTMSSTQQTSSAQTALASAVAASIWTTNVSRAWGPRNAASTGPVFQLNRAAADATSIDWAGALQWSQQFQDAGQATSQSELALNALSNAQAAVAVSVAAQTNARNEGDVLVPAGSRGANPSLAQQNLVSATSTSINVSSTEQWISQTQNGEAADESSYAFNIAVVDQSDDESVTAAQVDVTNRAGWLGLEPSGEGAARLTIVLETSRSAGIVETISISVDLPPPIYELRAPPRARPRLVTAVARTVAAAPLYLRATASPPAAAVRGALSHGSKPRRVRAHARSGADTIYSSAPSGVTLAAGAAGPAPGTGGGMPALTDERFTFAAPAHLGPRSPASALGPPMHVADPIERPG